MVQRSSGGWVEGKVGAISGEEKTRPRSSMEEELSRQKWLVWASVRRGIALYAAQGSFFRCQGPVCDTDTADCNLERDFNISTEQVHRMLITAHRRSLG